MFERYGYSITEHHLDFYDESLEFGVDVFLLIGNIKPVNILQYILNIRNDLISPLYLN